MSEVLGGIIFNIRGEGLGPSFERFERRRDGKVVARGAVDAAAL